MKSTPNIFVSETFLVSRLCGWERSKYSSLISNSTVLCKESIFSLKVNIFLVFPMAFICWDQQNKGTVNFKSKRSTWTIGWKYNYMMAIVSKYSYYIRYNNCGYVKQILLIRRDVLLQTCVSTIYRICAISRLWLDVFYYFHHACTCKVFYNLVFHYLVEWWHLSCQK